MSHVRRIDETNDSLPADVKARYEDEAKRAGRVTNMKAVLLNSPAAFDVFRQWGIVKDEVRKAVGERALSLYSHAISATAGCLLCTTYFRRLLIQEGIAPEDFKPEGDEALLIELGYAVGNPQQPPATDLIERVKARYGEKTLVDLVTYGGTMLATNVFNNLIGVEVDDYLSPFKRERPEKVQAAE
ncbi:MAG: hypothetical protein AB7S41_18355 [Parvibaculaceae bacterium]